MFASRIVVVRWCPPANGAACEALAATLPADERARAAGMAPGRRAGFVTGRTLARDLLGRRLGLAPAAVPLAVADDRPVLPPGTGWFVSITHSGPVVACAVARRPVGIDVESAADPPSESLVRRVAAPAEAEAILAAPDVSAAFLRAWVRKEAVAKAMGLGLDAGFATLDVRRSVVAAGGRVWRVRDLTLGGLPAAVAASGRWWSARVAASGPGGPGGPAGLSR